MTPDHHHEPGPTDPGTGPAWSGLDDDPRVQAGVEHLQRAAHELIAASRAALDVAEELVEAPGGVTRLFGILGELGETAARVVGSVVPADRADDDEPDPPVQRIPVS